MTPFESSFPFLRAGRGSRTSAREDPSRRLLDSAGLADDALLVQLGTSAHGLTETESASRLEREGANVIAAQQRRHPLVRLLGLFAQPLPLLLLALAIVTEVTGEVHGAIVIAAIVVMSVLLSFIQEHRSTAAAEKLRAMVRTTATALRRGGPDDAGGRAAPPWVEVPLEHAGAGRHRPAVGGRHDPRRRAAARRRRICSSTSRP